MKEVVKARDSTEAGLKTTEKQVKDLCKQLHYNEINLTTEKQLVTELREELKKTKEAVQLVKEATEAEKQASYTLGVEETQARLTEELTAVCRDYCSISWGKALDAVGVPVGSDLRRPESIYYDLEIRELPGSDSSQPKHLYSQRRTKSLLLLWKFLRIPTKAVAKERRLKTLKA